MSDPIAQTFIDALRTLERTRDAAPLAALYGDDAAVGNVIAPDKFHGPDGARQFWTEYRGAFETVESDFRNVIAAEGRAALEWRSRGTGPDGAALEYAGVTVLESREGRITRSCAYFNPAALGRQIEGTS